MKNLSRFDYWLDVFGRHSAEWLETLVRCTGIHNYQTQLVFTPAEKQFLANGLKFIPTPSPTPIESFAEQYLNDNSRGLVRFNRSIHNRLLHPPTADRRLAKFTPSRKSAPLHISDDDQLMFGNELKLLERYRAGTELMLRQAIQSVTIPKHLNFHRDDATFMHRLIDNPNIICKPADKNLGLVLVDASWYNTELNRMLSDTVTYEKFVDRTKNMVTQVNTLKKTINGEAHRLATKYRSTLEEWYGETQGKAMAHFITAGIPQASIAIPEIYLLIKVHKPKGLCGRPIVPCTQWLTTPASVLVDHLLQGLLKDHPIQWLVKDTKSLVNTLEHITLTQKTDILLTADIASLYTQIDTVLGLNLINQFLTEINTGTWRRNMINDLLKFVMMNSYFTFRGQVYHQIDGTAMGTTCAPVYANIVVYMLERKVLLELGTNIALYFRYLDDVFASIAAELSAMFQQRMNSLHPKLKFEFNEHPTEAAFLDLNISKGTRFNTDGRFDLRVHQKGMNLYLYIPFNSYHTDAAKRSFILTELTRYIRNNSSIEDYLSLRQLFWTRLRDRGYPSHFLEPIFNSIRYVDRPFFLLPASELLSSPLRFTQSPVSLCLTKRIAREELTALHRPQNSPGAACEPPVFIIPFTPLSNSILTRSLLLARWELVNGVTNAPPPIIAYQSCASIMVRLVHQKARRAKEQEQKKEFASTQSKQSVLPFKRTINNSSTNVRVQAPTTSAMTSTTLTHSLTTADHQFGV